MEATYLSELYDDFLISIRDYTLLSENITDEEIKEDLDSYFKKAKSKFYKCKQKLDTMTDVNGEEYFGYIDDDGKEVKVKLTGFEMAILIHLMLVEYIKPQVLSSEILRPSLSDKSFKIYSQANHLRELNLLYRLLQKESKKMITEYTYMDLEDTDL